MKYDLNKPCPHCGGNPMVANPTLYCSHIYYPEAVNKALRPRMVKTIERRRFALDYVVKRLVKNSLRLCYDNATPATIRAACNALVKAEKALDRLW